MDKEVLVKVEGVSKKFCKDLKRSLVYGLTDAFAALNPLHKGTEQPVLRKQEFWAVRDISFELRRGECLGLIGHNGAGKSTLLKILNGLINPDEGVITMRGKVGALIELGAGFNPILSGRENIYNNGAILGFTRLQIDEKIQEIIAFSEIEEFIDSPVQNYSSGMRVRLGFAIAAHLEPDVLIIDEVLAVGDLGFVLKCFQQIDKLLPNTAVIFVSHSMPMVARICNHIILMDHGIAEYNGKDVSKGIDAYYQKFNSDEKDEVVFTDGTLDFISCEVQGESDKEIQLGYGADVEISFVFKKNKILKYKPLIALVFYDKENRGVAEVYPDSQGGESVEGGNQIRYNVLLKNLCFTKGIYSITVTLSENLDQNIFIKLHNVIKLNFSESKQLWTSYLIESELK